MSTSGINKQVEKSNVGGKKFVSVNISSVYTGKSLVSQRNSAPVKHGLQSLGKTTAVARRMPPPANLPSLKSECAGQDPEVALVPSGAPGWGSNPNSQQPEAQVVATGQQSYVDGQQRKNSLQDATFPQPAHVAAAAASRDHVPTSNSSSSRQTWSTRIGPTPSSSSNAAPAGSSSAAANYFASMANMEFPQLSSESEKIGSGPSLRPQKGVGWKSGAINAASTAPEDSAASSGDRNGAYSASSSPTPHLQQHQQQYGGCPPPLHQSSSSVAVFPPGPVVVGPYPGHRQPPHPQQMFAPPPTHPYGMPPHPMMRHPAPYGPSFYGGPYGPPQQAGHNRDRYGQPLAPHYDDRGPPPHPPQSYYGSGNGGGATHARYHDETDFDDYQTPDPAAQQPPTGPPNRSAFSNSGGGSSAHPSRNQHQMMSSRYHSDPPYNEREWARDSYGGRDSGATAAPPREHRHRNYEGVWSDDEANEREENQYYNERRSNVTTDKQVASDTDDRYEQSEFNRRRSDRNPHPPRDSYYTMQQHQPQYRNAGYGPPYPANAQYYGMPPSGDRRSQPQTNDAYHSAKVYGAAAYQVGRYDPRHAPLMSQSIGPGSLPSYHNARDPRDLDEEEAEERARQHEQDCARAAAIEKSSRKRMVAQKSSVSSGGNPDMGTRDDYYVTDKTDRFNRPAEDFDHGDGEYAAYDKSKSEYARPSFQAVVQSEREDKSDKPVVEQSEDDENKFEVLRKSTKVMKRTAVVTPGKSSAKEATSSPSKSSNALADSASKSTNLPQKITIVKSDRQTAEANAQRAARENAESTTKETDRKYSSASASDQKSMSEAASTDENKPNVWEQRKEQQQMQQKEVSSFDQPSRQASIDGGNVQMNVSEANQPSHVKTPDNVSSCAGGGGRRRSGNDRDRNFDDATAAVGEYHPHGDGFSVRGRRGGGDRAASSNARGRGHREFVSSRRMRGSSHPAGGSRRGGWSRDDYTYNTGYEYGGTNEIGHRRGTRRFNEGGDNRRKSDIVEKKQHTSPQNALEAQDNAQQEATDVAANENKDNEGKERDSQKTEKKSRRQDDPSANQNRSQHRRGGGRSRRVTSDDYRQESQKQRSVDEYYSVGDEYRRGQRFSRGGGSVTRRSGGVPPRFSTSRQSNPNRQYNHTQNEDDLQHTFNDVINDRRGAPFEGDGANRKRSTPRNRRPASATSHLPPVSSSANRGGVNDVNAAAPTLSINVQSEGFDEWETASESSDVGGESRQRPLARDNNENHEKRKHTNPTKGTGNHRLSKMSGQQSPIENGPTTWNSYTGQTAGSHRPPGTAGGGGARRHKDRGRGPSDENTTAGRNKENAGPKNLQVASHQHHPGSEPQRHASNQRRSAAVNARVSNTKARHLQAPRAQQQHQKISMVKTSSEERTTNTQRKTDALATIDFNNVAGVHVIDYQPDVVSITDNNEGFQEVVSKKERRNRKENMQLELERKSQSPGKTTKSKDRQELNERQISKQKSSSNSSHLPQHVAKRGTVADDSATQRSNAQNTWNQSLVQICQSADMTSVVEPNESIASKTGVEIWGTPDPLPFVRNDNEQQQQNVEPTVSSKCVVRPTKHLEDNVPMKSVEFVTDAFNNINDNFGVNIDFTFGADMMPTFDGSSEPCDAQYKPPSSNNNMNTLQPATAAAPQSPAIADQHNSDLSSVNMQPPLTSPSTDQLSEKIASVKKVWDSLHSVLSGGEDNLTNGGCNQPVNSSQSNNLMIVDESCYYNSVSGASSAEIQAALSMSNAVYTMSHVIMSQHHGEQQSGMHLEHSSAIASKSPPCHVPQLNSMQQVVPSSKSSAEGPNVAKVRPQQQQTPARQPSIEAAPFLPASSNVNRPSTNVFATKYHNASNDSIETMMPPMHHVFVQQASAAGVPSSTMYGSMAQTHGGSFIFQNPYQLNGMGTSVVGKAMPPQNLDLFNAAAGRQYMYHHPPAQSPQNAPPPSMVIAAAQQPTPLDGDALRPASNAANPAADMFASFGAMRGPPPTGAPPGGYASLNVKAAAGNAFLMPSDGAGLSLFTQPPPALSRSTPCQPGVYAFAAHQASTAAPPPPFGPHGAASFGAKPLAAAPPIVNPTGYGNWNTAQPKMFNPTIGPPAAHPGKVYNPSMYNMTASNGFPTPTAFTASVLTAPKKTPSGGILVGLTSLGNAKFDTSASAMGAYRRVDDDSTKRDGDLLQQIDNFINSTTGGDEDAAMLVAQPVAVALGDLAAEKLIAVDSKESN